MLPSTLTSDSADFSCWRDAAALREAGVAAVYTPKDWDLNAMMRDIISLVAERNTAAPA